MSDAVASAPWWERLGPGRSIPAGIVLIDCDFADVTGLDDTAHRQRARYAAGVEYVARLFGAAEPIAWENNRATLILGGEEPQAIAAHAFTAARYLWQRAFVDLGIPARVAVHAGRVVRRSEPGAFDGPALELSGALLDVAPPQAIALSPEVALSLQPNDHGDLAPLQWLAEADDLAYVFPRGARLAGQSLPEGAEREIGLWDALRAYANGPDVRSLRYVGFRLQRKEPLCLDIADVFVEPHAVRRTAPLEDPGRAPRDGGPLRGRQRAAQEEGPPALLGALLKESRRLVLLGDPGAGKTTSLRWLAATAAEGGLPALVGDVEPALPLAISVGRLAELRHADRRGSLPHALARYYAERDVASEDALRPFLERCLRRGRCLLLLDGLDEVRAELRAETQRWLEDSLSLFPANRVAATSRVVGYAGFRAADGAVEATLRPFEPPEIETYLRAFHRAYLAWEWGAPRAKEAKALSDGLLGALRQSPRLSALASNPFMLSALALIHRAEGRLPRHRVQAYELLSRALCETWDTARRLVAAEHTRAATAYEEEAVPILGDLALAMHEKHPTGVAPTAFVESTLTSSLARRRGVDPEEAAKAARNFLKRATEEAPILLERGPDRWGFSHLTFQEFFVAAGLHATERFESVALKHALEPRWEEILRLGVGHMALIQNRKVAAERFVMQVLDWRAPSWCRWVDQVLQKQILVAAALAAELPSALPAKERSRLVRAVREYARRLRADDRPISADLRVNEEVQLFLKLMKELADSDIAEPLARALVEEVRGLPVDEARILIAAVGALRVRDAMAQLADILVPTAPEGSNPFRWIARALREAVEFDELAAMAHRSEPRWRALAIEALGFPSLSRAAPIFAEALRDRAVEVREAAASGLLKLSLPESLEAHLSQAALIEALEDCSEEVRDTACWLVDREKFSTSAVEDALLTIVRNDASQRVRYSAAFTALRLFASDRVLDIVMGILAETRNYVDRWDLVQGFGVRSDTKAAQLRRVLEGTRSSNELLRAGCVLALWMFPSEGAEDVALRAANDTSGVVRREAITALSQMNSSAIIEVASAILKDSDPSVREASAYALSWRPGSAAEKALLGGLGDPTPTVRKVCVYGLRRRRSAEVTTALLAALRDKEAEVREEAISALEEIEEDRVTQALLWASSDDSDRVRAAAARALGTRKDPGVLTRLIRLLADVSQPVRWNAARSIAAIDDAAAVPPLVRQARREPAARAALWRMAERRGWKIPRLREGVRPRSPRKT